ncbi:hypothetical protein BACCIP111883_02646 [Sutcliffiella rhizosphaerae]|uniref:Uncharacterized protein n=1 Tax=Sutcliffiella rhizosphaerae TaxID=2880967 RepID=A0ABM8YPF6_9BACI|nr:hypothetical protein BACCIP111883_02646 [Sutcliffiella rhizosphaerae]
MRFILKIIEGFLIVYFFTFTVILGIVNSLTILSVKSIKGTTIAEFDTEMLLLFFIYLFILFLFIKTYKDCNTYSKVMLSIYLFCFSGSIIVTLMNIIISFIFIPKSYVEENWMRDLEYLLLSLLLFFYTLHKLRDFSEG